uniref:Uncharacterized protein n=1 Tax=Anguilla anguilla TaxID=7936 RepID=A0A0E9QQN7_ANGAN
MTMDSVSVSFSKGILCDSLSCQDFRVFCFLPPPHYWRVPGDVSFP